MPDLNLNPILPIHEQATSEFQSWADIPIVSTFGEPQAEYSAIRKAAALIDLPQRGILEVSGKDRLSFLNNMLTNQTWDKQTRQGMPAGSGVYAFLLNNKGRVVADMNVLELGDRAYLEMDARLVDSTRATLEKYIFSEQAKFQSLLGQLHSFAIHGPGAPDLIKQIASIDVAAFTPLQCASVKIDDQPATIFRDDQASVPGFGVIVPTNAAGNIWNSLIERFAKSEDLGKRPLRPIGWAVFNTARIEGGRPIFGIDFDDTVLPAEAGQLSRAVSFTKGCYLGQEIVARMHARGQIARQLVGIKMDSNFLPIAGAPIFDNVQNQIGGITSSTVSPVLSKAAIAIGFVKKQFTQSGTALNIAAEGAIRPAKVVELPFIPAIA